MEPTEQPVFGHSVLPSPANVTGLEKIVAILCLMRDAYLVSDPARRAVLQALLRDPGPDGPS